MNAPRGAPASKGAPASVSELQGLLRLKRAPAVLGQEELSALVARAEAPTLEGLTVAWPAVAPVTEEDLLERFEDLRREAAHRRDREPGERIAQGDEVLLDILGYHQGRLLPFSARADWWASVLPEPLLPGFFEALVGIEVGEVLTVNVTPPPEYPVKALRGTPAQFVVSVKAARELTLPEEDEAPEFLLPLGRGATLLEVMERLGEELADERRAQASQAARELALELLAERSSVKVSPQLIDEELRRRWAEGEQPALESLGLAPDELQESLDGWLRDPLTRAEAALRLKIALVLGAIAERERLQPRPEDVEWLMDTLMQASQASREEVGEWMRNEQALAQQAHNLLMHLAAVEHVMSKVTFTRPGHA